MTEAEWLVETWRPQWMADALSTCGVPRTKAGRRRLRLFACACCCVAWDVIPDDLLRAAVEVAERFADGKATKGELASAGAVVAYMQEDSHDPNASTDIRVAIDMALDTTEPQAYAAAFGVLATVSPFAGCVPAKDADRFACDLMRCVFGNPFRPVVFEKAWRTSTAVALARGIADGRAFDRLPILADALQDAGCEDAAVLNHCRGTGPHGYGCWVVDAVLGIK